MRMSSRTIVICPPDLRDHVFPAEVLGKIRDLADFSGVVLDPGAWQDCKSELSDVECILSTWGMPVLSDEFLAAMPGLRAVFYAAGSVKGFVTDAAWDRGIIISSAWAANSIPVAEYALAAILLSLKRFWHFSRGARTPQESSDIRTIAGCYKSNVGLVSLGAVGRETARRLAAHDLNLLAYDPFCTPETAAELHLRLVSLDELFRESDVVSVHSPWIPATERMITGPLISSMKDGATLLNTSRGAVIAEDEMIEVLRRRPDLSAVLDVTYPEPAAKDSPLRSLPNVILTPHIAGSMHQECSRMAEWMVDELRRYLNGDALHHSVNRGQLDRMA